VPSTTTDHEPSIDKPAVKNVTFPSHSVDASELTQSNTLGSPYDSFPFPEIATIRKDQLDYCISHFQGCITTLVQQSQNLFMHFTSYQETLPIAYQDLLSICALHSQRNPRNKTVIFRMLDDKVKALLAQANTSFCSVEDRLLQLQAMLLYQFMRLFDGDIRQRANAERDFEPLEAWTIELHQTYAASGNELSWESPYRQWVLLESVRRTIMMSVVLQSAYSAIRDGLCYLVPFLSALPMSTNASLWGASEDNWWQAKT
jgi:hypothetical protein